MRKSDLKHELEQLKVELHQLQQKSERISYIATTPSNSFRAVKHRERYCADYTTESKDWRTTVLISRDGKVDTVEFPGKWTIAQIKAAANG